MLVLILILEITAAGMAIAYRAKAEDETRKFLQTTIKDYYTPQRDKSDVVTLMWNYLMAQMSCCGLDSFEDFSDKFKEENSTQLIPAACCVLEGDIRRFTPKFPNCTTSPSYANSYYMTDTSTWELEVRHFLNTDSEQNDTANVGLQHSLKLMIFTLFEKLKSLKGCYKTVLNWVLDHINVVIWVVLGTIFVELFTVFLSFCLCKALQGYDDDK
ncbi:Tetraspanin [Homalodisca vitripennis]|nr:Tetraspanin [Homalodisca vitripennis]